MTERSKATETERSNQPSLFGASTQNIAIESNTISPKELRQTTGIQFSNRVGFSQTNALVRNSREVKDRKLKDEIRTLDSEIEKL